MTEECTIYLYFWDNKKDMLSVSKEDLWIHPQYPNVNAVVKGAKGYQVSGEEGKVYQNKLWLKERDDEKAKKAFSIFYKKKKMYLDNQLTKMWRRINRLDSLQVLES